MKSKRYFVVSPESKRDAHGRLTRRVAFFVKDNRPLLRECLDSCGQSPAEAHYGVGVLSAQADFEVLPHFVGRQGEGLIRAAMGHLHDWLVPGPMIFWSRYSAQLAGVVLRFQTGWSAVVSTDNLATATLLSLRERGLLRCPVSCLLMGVPDWLEQCDKERRVQTLRYLANADSLLVLNRAEADYLRACGLPKIGVLPFGVDAMFWEPSDQPVEDYVGSLGSDSGRDYQTLAQACPYPVRILTRLPDSALPRGCQDVAVLRGGGLVEARRFLARARVVAVPLQDRLQPSGQSTALQAMAMAKSMVLTRTQGLWTERIRDGVDCVYVKPADPGQLRAAIEFAWDRQTAARLGAQAATTARGYFDIRHLVEGWVRAVGALLDERAAGCAE